MDDTATVLLVDDDPGVADTAAAFVERANDAITTTTATSPESALDRFEAGDIDCIVSDYNMPGMDGLALFEEVAERDSEIPFILFTGKGSEEVASEAISLGVTDYLQKEAGTDQYEVLANQIENAIEARRAEQRFERSEERYQHLVESSPAGIVLHRPDGIVYANEAAAALYGADDPAELVGLAPIDVAHPADQEQIRHRQRRVMDGETLEPIEERFVGPDGETRYATVASMPATYEGERVIQSVLTDVTQQRRAEQRLSEEREFTERALDALDDTFYVTDPSGQLSRWNDQLAAITGYTDEEIGEMYPQEFVVEGDEERIAEAFTEVVETGRTTTEVDLETKDGDRIPYELVAATMTDEEGQIVGVCGTGRDITEQKQRERDLERSRERYQHLVESAPAGVVITTPDDTIVYANEAAASFIGADDPEEIHGMATLDLVHPEDKAKLRERWAGSREREPQDSLEERFVGFDGETRYAVVASTPVTYEGEPAVQTVLTDVTQQRRAEQQLREEREFTERALDALDDGFYVIDESGAFVRWNDQVTAVTGYTDEEIAAMDPAQLFVEEDRTRIFEGITGALETGRASVEATLETRDGERIPYEFAGANLTDDEGQVVGMCGIGRDITERRERERDLERYERLVETVDDALYTVDGEGRFTFVNDSFVDLTGYDRADLLGSDVSVIKNTETVERFEEQVHEMLRGDHDETYVEFDLRTAGGESIPCEDHMVLRTDEGEYAGVAGVIRDVTERRERERDLERYETAIEAAPVGVYVVDVNGTIVWTNERAASSIDYTRAELAGKPFVSLVEEGIVPEASLDEYLDLLGDLLSAETDRTAGWLEVPITHPDGDQRTIRTHVAPLPYDQEFRGAVLVNEDITEHKQRERDLERYETAMEVAPVGVFVLDDDGTVTWCNERAAAFVYHAATDLIGDPFESLVREGIVSEAALDEYADVLRVLLSAETDRTVGAYEIPVTPPEGDRRTLRAHVSLLPYDGEFEGTVLVAEDITERKQPKRELEVERNSLAALFENVPDPVYRHSPDGDVAVPEEINPAFERVFGYEPAEIVGRPITETIVPPEGVEEHKRLVADSKAGETLDVEVGRLTATGPRTFLLHNVPIDGTVGKHTEEYAIYTDITPQKRRERVLTDLHDRTREMMQAEEPEGVAAIAIQAIEDVLELPMSGLWLHDEDAEVLRPVAGTDDPDVVGESPTYEPGNSLSWAAFAAGETRVYEDVGDADAHNPETRVGSEMILPLGEYGVLNVGTTSAGEFDDADEALARLLATNVEAALDRAERERERAARKRLLERQNERLEEFAGVVSHDLRNPLTVASGRLELLSEEVDSQHVQPIVDALDRMDDLIEECLTFARQGQIVTDPEWIDIEDVAERAWGTVETGDADLTVEGVGTVEADDERFRTLFENLFRNAIEHADATAVRVGPLGDTPGVSVADDGSGIPESEREAVFDRGYSTAGDGTGLGLAIVETLAEAHGWEVALVDGEAGARFEVRFEPAAPLTAPPTSG